jgi:hypothetical protein
LRKAPVKGGFLLQKGENMAEMKKRIECDICGGLCEIKTDGNGKEYWRHGENPHPYEFSDEVLKLRDNDPRCCKVCNNDIVIPLRLGFVTMEELKNES